MAAREAPALAAGGVGRRRWLRIALGSGAAALAGGAGTLAWLDGEPAPVAKFPDLDAALAWIDTVARAPQARSMTHWPPAHVLEHAAQSVEYSLDGYPQLRSELFRASAGAFAFALFARRGTMSHATTEPIPGAPVLQATRVTIAAQRLVQALLRFEDAPPRFAFAPHFAYGALDKDQYRRAHLMHLADHAREIVV